MNDEVSLVITSCGRFDLLEETLDSFFKYNTYPIKKIIITEDSTEGNKLKKLVSKYENQNFQLIVNETRLGQLKSIDKAYKEVDTEYVFHCEDDWEFFREGFIEKSIELLKEDEKILIVGGRAKEDYVEGFFFDESEDYVSKSGERFYKVKGEIFTYNPGLRRKKDMDLFGLHEKLENQRYEEVLSDFYKEKGFKTIFFKEPFVRHIGNKRHVHFSNKRKNTILNFKIDRLIKKIRAKILKLKGKL